MAKPTRQEQIDSLTQSEDVRRLIKLNMFSAEDLVDEFDRQMKLVCSFKQALIDDKLLDRLLHTPEFPGTIDQQCNFMMIMIKSVGKLDDFDKAIAHYLPVIALITVMLKKQDELRDLAEAISS